MQLWGALGASQRITVVVASLVVVLGMVAMVTWSSRPDYQMVYGGLDENDASAVISHLQQSNIPFRTEQGGAAVFVPADQVHRARMDLAGKGLPSGEGVGFEIFDRGDFGVSDFVQRTNHTRALQGELSRTITKLEGVKGARVLIVQPESRLLLVDQSARASASVFVDVGSGRLPLEAVNAIRHLVSSAVQGMDPNQVSVVDNRGRMLTEELRDDPMLGSASGQMRYRQSVEEYFARKVETMLLAVVGPGNAVVRVSADVDTDATTISEERFDPDATVARTQTITEDVTSSSEGKGGGAAGASANGAGEDPAAAAAQTVRNEQSRKNRTTSFEINTVRTSTVRNPGTVRGLTASVFLNQRTAGTPEAPAPAPRTPAEIETLRQLVANALGVKPAAGLTLESLVTVQEIPMLQESFAPEAEQMMKQQGMQNWIDMGLRALPIVLGAILLLFFFRKLGKEAPESVPTEFLDRLPRQNNGSHPGTGAITPDILNQLLRQKSDNVGTAIRDWVATEKAQ